MELVGSVVSHYHAETTVSEPSALQAQYGASNSDADNE